MMLIFHPFLLLAERRRRVQGLHDQRPGEPALHHVRPRPGLQLGIYSKVHLLYYRVAHQILQYLILTSEFSILKRN